MKKFNFNIESRFNLLLMMGLFNVVAFTLLRFVFFIRSWNEIDNGLIAFLFSFPVGFIYDCVFNLYLSLFFSIILLLIPEIIFKSKIFKYLTYSAFVMFVFWIFFVLVGEWLFWDEFQVRFNFIAVDYLIYTREVVANIYESYPILKILSVLFVFSVLTVYLLRKKINKSLEVVESFKKRVLMTLSLFVLAFSSYFFIGQGLKDIPENNYVKEVASNGPYQFVAAFRNNELNYKEFFLEGDNVSLSKKLKINVGKDPEKDGLFDISRQINSAEEEKRLNVILISVESLSAKYLTEFGNDKNWTPFLDTLKEESLYFPEFYATGTRTTRGLEAITLSVPPTPGRSIVKRPDNARIYSIGKVFKDKGYDVAFLYGGRGFFDNMNAFFKGNGYRIVDENDFDKSQVTFKNAWGVCDGDLFNKTIEEADKAIKSDKPFFFHIMTTSNHRPYTYPEGKIDIPSGTGRSGAVKYTDYTIKILIEEAKKHEWFKDTVFVITADHCAGSAGKIGLPVIRYHIPLWIYCPSHIEPKIVSKISSQIDIGPTVFSLMNFRYESHFFGNDIFSKEFVERALIANYQKLGMYKDNKLVVLAPGKKLELFSDPLGDIKLLSADKFTPVVEDAMSYYQGSYYIWKNRISRY